MNEGAGSQCRIQNSSKITLPREILRSFSGLEYFLEANGGFLIVLPKSSRGTINDFLLDYIHIPKVKNIQLGKWPGD